MIQFVKKHAEAFKVAAFVLFFAVLFVLALIRFVPSFGYADLTEAQPIRKENKLYYNTLSRKEQFLYDALTDAIDSYAEYTDEIRCVFTSADFSHVVQCLISDNPQYFFVDYNSIESYVSETHTKVRLVYYENEQTVRAMREELDRMADTVMEQLRGTEEDFEKELYLHDYLVQNCTYLTGVNGENYLSNTAYGALCRGEAYCDGYALAFKLLMNRAGLFCSTVSGLAGDLQHMWNLVYINDQFYHVDVTWDDADTPDMVFHGYFNLSADAISISHTIASPELLPLCEDTTHYYRALGRSATDVETLDEILYQCMNTAAEAGMQYFEFSIDYADGLSDLRAAYTRAVERINSEGKYHFVDAYRDHPLSDNRSFLYLEIYYEVEA